MKQTIDRHGFCEAFNRIRPEQFSRPALLELFAWYEDIDPEWELDVIAICGDWTEYGSAVEAAEAYGWEAPEGGDDERADKAEEQAREWLADETTVLETATGSVLVQNF